MSIIFGIRAADEEQVCESRLRRLAQATECHALDGTAIRTNRNVGMGFQPRRTHERSTLEKEPISDAQGNMLAFDGRIDNHVDLADLLGLDQGDRSDSRIVLAAFDLWGAKCFSRFVGDWAIALWSHSDRSLYLARDHAGARTLYFFCDGNTLIWSTYIDTFFSHRTTYPLSSEFASSYLVGHRIHRLTPYAGIRAVPPASYICFSGNQVSYTSHWSPLVPQTILYRTDAEYEDHFRHLFAQAVARRTLYRASPIVAELSGGMDSSSIVCMADEVRQQVASTNNPLETISYYDDSEPNWNERPYFSMVEAQRNRIGLHMTISFASRAFEPVPSSMGIYRWPGATRSTAEHDRLVEAMLTPGGYRSILSGIGGDELLGGVPFPLPELADHIASGRFVHWLNRSLKWCLRDRTPFVFMLRDSFLFMANAFMGKESHPHAVPPWVSLANVHLTPYEPVPSLSTGERIAAQPSTLTNRFTWASILETLSNRCHPPSTRFEYLYPYLDRDLVEFLLQVPREQLVQPGRRRALMRRALRGIVPTEILERRRKAYAIRGPLYSLQQAPGHLRQLFADSHLAQIGLIDSGMLVRSLNDLASGVNVQWWPSLVRAVLLELWLQKPGAGHDRLNFGVAAPSPQKLSGALANCT
jgi:asparagine synthase (glutamine-hydrolysing)